MTDQLQLFPEPGEAHARHTDPSTSKQAAAQVRGEEANRIEGIVADAVRASPAGLTTWEIADATGLLYSTVTPRIRPLIRKGMLRDSGTKRPSPSGRNCIVWGKT